MTTSVKLIKPSVTERAFIYQQTQELASCLPIENIPISVLLEKVKSKTISQHCYGVTFAILSLSSLTLSARCEANTLEEACIGAKNQLKEKLQSLLHMTKNLPNRNEIIDSIKAHPYLH